ncbi:chemotaxis protein CheW [Georgenia yuyongxinii]|uniref:Chemotaxis protein CheW n=1 Tax=Georgenia yuyongxinii TaxID=2589797 RepID=A0A552WJK8_9MICO|nr:chemotaxis protein CheW [Georgenia yuyongxinii]TRW42916.1 chemotaxis protein CheW [Georgenia yuyongxinii]
MTELVTFTVAGARCAVDVTRVREVVRAARRTPVPLAPPDVDGLMNLRGQVLMCLDPRTRLGLDARFVEGDRMAIVVDARGETLGLLVDEVGEVVDLDPGELRPAPTTLDPTLRANIIGAHPLPDGLLLVLDLDAVTAPCPTSLEKEHLS